MSAFKNNPTFTSYKNAIRPFAIIVLTLLILFITFGSLISVFAQDNKTKENPRQDDFTRGVQAWANHCSRCHNMRDPKELRDDQWKVVVSHMRVRAGLTGQEARDILRFLQESN